MKWLVCYFYLNTDQKEYYKALRESDSRGNSTAFIKFMLDIILKALKVFDKKTSGKALGNTNNDNVKDNVNDNVKLSKNQKAILEMLVGNRFATQADIAKELRMTTANANRNIKKLKELGFVKREGSDKSGCWVVKS